MKEAARRLQRHKRETRGEKCYESEMKIGAKNEEIVNIDK